MARRKGGDGDLGPVLKDLDRMITGVLTEMDKWEAELHRSIEDGHGNEVEEVASRGSKLGSTAKEVRGQMTSLKASKGKAIEEQGLDELSSGIEIKCDLIEERLEKALQEVMAVEESLGERIHKALYSMDDLGNLDFYPDVNSDDELRKEFAKKGKSGKK